MGQIQYSEKYFDDIYEYRHVVLPTEVAKLLPKNRLLSEVSCLMSGVQLGFNRAEGGFTTQFTARSHTLCFSGGHLTTSSRSRRIKFSKTYSPSDQVPFMRF
ncbi:hypothetical protein MIMGU_mgv1a016924mg [Erythranthe guttata]|uniref:Cyclin-dependent kinases regulatory subunit n=1 Tax=Erythranthe guttata TaxID=4155 RepID=A0A022R7Y0_ERYGU|nr:hypothetical protein MIMGU_mgv1a016924mg [Erythranthe guttata]